MLFDFETFNNALQILYLNTNYSKELPVSMQFRTKNLFLYFIQNF